MKNNKLMVLQADLLNRMSSLIPMNGFNYTTLILHESNSHYYLQWMEGSVTRGLLRLCPRHFFAFIGQSRHEVHYHGYIGAV